MSSSTPASNSGSGAPSSDTSGNSNAPSSVAVAGDVSQGMVIEAIDEKDQVVSVVTASSTAAQKPQKTVIWECNHCKRQCIPVRSQSWCLCGHRYNSHPSDNGFKCKKPKCPCSGYFYIVAQGSWMLRCRCKHKHTFHDSSALPYKCKKPKCKCEAFDSPWVCNCDHPWVDHSQLIVDKQTRTLSDLLAAADMQGAAGVARGAGSLRGNAVGSSSKPKKKRPLRKKKPKAAAAAGSSQPSSSSSPPPPPPSSSSS